MSITGIQGQPLEVTVVGGSKLRDTEWFSRQDPYVCLEYGSTKFRTRTCTDGGKNPMFQEKFVFQLIEGLREINFLVWNSNTVSTDDFIGSGKIQLAKVLSQGYDDSAWPLSSKHGRYAGEVRLILHYQIPAKHNANWTPSAAPTYAPPHSTPQPHPYAAPPPHAGPYMPQSSAYPTYPAYPTPQPAAAYPPQSYQQPPPSAYPPQPYQQPPSSAYPPSPYQQPPSGYPSSPYPYAPPPQGSPYYPPGPYPGAYPPRPY